MSGAPRLAVVLVQPRIPQNAGAIGRLCSAATAELHIVRPIPFSLNDRSLRRAGMDYLADLSLTVHDDWAACTRALAGRRLWALTSRGTCSLYEVAFRADDALVLGSEEAGLPEEVTGELSPALVRIPMPNPRARCLNLATSAGIVLFEALRQTRGWPGEA